MRILRRETGVVKEVTKGGDERYTPVIDTYLFGAHVDRSPIFETKEDVLREDASKKSFSLASIVVDKYLDEKSAEVREKEAKKVVEERFIKYP